MANLIFNLQKCPICNDDLIESDQSSNECYHELYLVRECKKCKFFCEERISSEFDEIGRYYFSIFIGEYVYISDEKCICSIAIENDHIQCEFHNTKQLNSHYYYNSSIKEDKIKKYIEGCNYVCKIINNYVFI